MSRVVRWGLTALLWLAFAVGGGVVILGALGEGPGDAPPPGAGAGAPRDPGPPKRWDFTSDFVRVAAAARNPSPDRYGGAGVWRYTAATRERSRDPADFALLRRFGEGLQGLTGFDAWFGRDDPSVAISFPIVGVRGARTRRPQGFAHPSSTRRAIVAWRSPIRATVTLRGSVSDLDVNGGDGVTWALRRGRRTVARGRLANGGRAQRFREPEVSVAPGDVCALLIAPGAGSANDSTGITLRIEEQRATRS